MSVGATRKNGRAAVAGGRHERVALCLKAAADRHYSRHKAVPGEMTGYVGTWLRSVAIHGGFRIENVDVDLGPWGSKCRRVAQGMRCLPCGVQTDRDMLRSEEHTSELPSLMRISDAVLCLKKQT